MKRLLFIFSIIFIFIFSFSSSAESVTNTVDLSNVTNEELNTIFENNVKDKYSAEVTDDGIVISGWGHYGEPNEYCTLDISKWVNVSVSDIILKDVSTELVSSNGYNNYGLILYDGSFMMRAKTWVVTTITTQKQNISLLGDYYLYPNDKTSWTWNETQSIVSVDESILPYIKKIVFYQPNDNQITFSGITFSGEKVITSPTLPAQTGNIISPDDMGLNIWNGLTNNSGNLIIILSVALSIVGVFIAIKIALNLFHEGVK